MKTCYTIPSSL